MRKIFKGFTLTELMVALTVIGILVAIVTPAIIKNRPNKNKMMVKKTYYATEQIVNSLINDTISYPDMRDACRAGQDNNDDIYCAWGFDYVYGTDFEGKTYEGEWKFAALFKEYLNIKSNIASSKEEDATPDDEDFYPIFITSDGVQWDLSETEDAWESGKDKVGTFDENTGANKNNFPGIGTITIDVDTSNDTSTVCEDVVESSCDTYEIQILANGKMRINPDHIKAINWVTINTAIRDN